MSENKKETIGIILLNLGGPDSIQAVKPFLYNLFSDRRILKLGPSFLQKPLAWVISTIRSKHTEKLYNLIGGKSPIFDITAAQAKALEKAMTQQSNPPCPPLIKGGFTSFKVYVGMRYWHPFIDDVIPLMVRDGIRKIIALSLYPQYSIATSGSSIFKLKEAVKDYPLEISYISSWFNHPLYIKALIDLIKKGIESFGQITNDIHVLFSAHSLPQKFIDKGDTYVKETLGTIEEITKQIQIKWHLSYQSKSGPVKWLSPSTEEKLRELARGGVKNVLVVPISFVSDHIETLYEIDIFYKDMAERLGMTLKRTDSLNIHPVFISALKDIVRSDLKKAGWD
ncbi:MAG: ferrochelatase [Nitrospirota bacterium]